METLNLRPRVPPSDPAPVETGEDLDRRLMRDFVFSPEPLLYDPTQEIKQQSALVSSGEDTDPEDYEARIQSSWHHRALLGDENRTLHRETEDTQIREREDEDEEPSVVFVNVNA